jgi:hypothetical protein
LKTENSVEYIEKKAHRLALLKGYVTFATQLEPRPKPGDLVYIYRTKPMAGNTTPAKYTSVITTLTVIDEFVTGFESYEEFSLACENRTVFSQSDLIKMWSSKGKKCSLVRLIEVETLKEKVILDKLYKLGIVEQIFRTPSLYTA